MSATIKVGTRYVLGRNDLFPYQIAKELRGTHDVFRILERNGVESHFYR